MISNKNTSLRSLTNTGLSIPAGNSDTPGKFVGTLVVADLRLRLDLAEFCLKHGSFKKFESIKTRYLITWSRSEAILLLAVNWGCNVWPVFIAI